MEEAGSLTGEGGAGQDGVFEGLRGLRAQRAGCVGVRIAPRGVSRECNDPTIGSYNHYHLDPNGIPRGIQRWYGLVYFIQIAGKPRIRPRQQSSSFEVLY